MTVFADGPTRVLRFADVLDQGAEEAEQSILDLAARLRQVEEQLWRVNASFSALHGASGARRDPCFSMSTIQICMYRFTPDGPARADASYEQTPTSAVHMTPEMP